jgi:hypothetical protein
MVGSEIGSVGENIPRGLKPKFILASKCMGCWFQHK